MKIRKLLGMPGRVIRYALYERSYERYYSADIWDEKYGEGSYNLNRKAEDGRYGALMSLMRRYDNGSSIMDAGCGDGLLQERYRVLSATRMVGIDYSEIAVEKARAKCIENCEFHCSDFRRFETTELFELIVLNEALYYVDDFSGVMDALVRRLTPDGVIIVSMFDTLVTARIWKKLLVNHKVHQGIRVVDEISALSWRLRVLSRRI